MAVSISREIEDIAKDLIRHQHDHPPVRDLNREVDRKLTLADRIADRDRLRAQHDYELDVKAEEELKALMNHLMHQDEILLQIVNRLDRGDREMKRLLRRLEGAESTSATRPGGV